MTITTLLRWRSNSATDVTGLAAIPADGVRTADGGRAPAASSHQPGSVRVQAQPAPAPARRPEPSRDEVAECVARRTFLWLDVEDPTEADFDRLRHEFGVHPLTIEDIKRPEQRPKLETYPAYYFLVFHAITLSERGRVEAQQIGMFLGPTFFITVHYGRSPAIEESARRWEHNRDEVGQSLGTVVYSVLDSIVDAYFPVVDQLVEHVEQLEEAIVRGATRHTMSHMFRLRRNLLKFRRILGPERDVLNVLIRREAPVFDDATAVYLQDVYDHVLRLTDTIDLYRDLLASALDAHLSVTSNNLNVVMKRMTALSTILMSLALIAGIYGMNFKVMPELDWPLGYAYALGLMAIVGVGLTLFFRRIGWF